MPGPGAKVGVLALTKPPFKPIPRKAGQISNVINPNPVTENLGLTDAGTAIIVSGTWTDTLGLTDSVTVTFTPGGTAFTVNQTDILGLIDSVFFDLNNQPKDVLGLIDTLVFDIQKSFTDTTGLTDTPTLSISKSVGPDDLGLTDSAVPAFTKNFTDTLGLTDSATTSLTTAPTNQFPVDPMGLTDAGQLLSRTGRLTDTLSLTDTVTVSLVQGNYISLYIEENMGLTEYAPGPNTVDDYYEEELSLSDGITAIAVSGRLTDTLGLTDSVTVTLFTGQQFTQDKTEDLGLTDAVMVVLSSPWTENPANAGTWSQTSTQTASFSENTVNPDTFTGNNTGNNPWTEYSRDPGSWS